MRCYVPIDENVKAEDETLLAYLPYFGESAESCVDEIVESYGGCNDNTSSMDTSIDDSIIKSLVETATDKISETNEGYSSDHNGLDVFQAICEAIPLKISPQKLLQKFNNMKKLDAPDAEVHDEEPCEERSIQDNEAPHKEQLPDKNVKPNAVRKLASTSRKRKVPSLGQNGTRNYCTPCDHEGKCSAECSCFGKKNYCETFCKCAADCSRRFPGKFGYLNFMIKSRFRFTFVLQDVIAKASAKVTHAAALRLAASAIRFYANASKRSQASTNAARTPAFKIKRRKS